MKPHFTYHPEHYHFNRVQPMAIKDLPFSDEVRLPDGNKVVLWLSLALIVLAVCVGVS